jgi:uncharacterized short protein YbdD (DUF466 family)
VEDWSVLLRSLARPPLSCRPAGGAVEDCFACARAAAGELRRGWRRAIGAPDYRAYLAHHTARHPDTVPMSERDYVRAFIERRYNGAGASRCC